MRYYILEGKVPVEVEDYMTWAQNMSQQQEQLKHRVERTELPGGDVSTVFLGIATNHEGPPLIFETMIFGGEHSHYQERYSTWEEAEEGHHRACAMVLTS